MKISQRFLAVAILLLAMLDGCSRHEDKKQATLPRQMVLAISPYLQAPTNVFSVVSAWLMHQAGFEVHVLNGWDGTEITSFPVPKVQYFKESSVARRIGAPLMKWEAWTGGSHLEPKLAGTGALNVPLLLERISQSHLTPERLILIGSPVARLPSNPDYDFAEPQFRYPSNAHLKSPNSLFCSLGKEHSLAGVRVYFLFANDNVSQWPNKYEEHLRMFFSGLFGTRGGALVSFTPDQAAGLRLAETSTPDQIEPFDPPAFSGPVTMIEEGTETPPTPSPIVEVVKQDPLTDSTLETATTDATKGQEPSTVPANSNSVVSTPAPTNSPPAPQSPERQIVTAATLRQLLPIRTNMNEAFQITQGTSLPHPPTSGVTIAIRYRSDNASADLYVRPFSDAEELSFHQITTLFGSYSYEFDAAAGEHVKWVYLPPGCDPTKGTAWINYSSGVGRMAGSVIWMTADGHREIPFSFGALEGGDSTSKREVSRRKSLHWVRVNLMDFVVGLPTQGGPNVVHP